MRTYVRRFLLLDDSVEAELKPLQHLPVRGDGDVLLDDSVEAELKPRRRTAYHPGERGVLLDDSVEAELKQCVGGLAGGRLQGSPRRQRRGRIEAHRDRPRTGRRP